MKLIKNLTFLAAVILLAACSTMTPNKKENFDFGWKFHAGALKGAENPAYNDSSWRKVDLPHDWSIEGDFNQNNPSFSRGGWLPTGKVVYRKTFAVPSDQKDKRFVIYFDGAYRNSSVYLNGHLLGKRPFGYISFHYDMTPYIHVGGENVLTVKLDNSEQPGSRWYTGTGIYRHVSLIETNKIYIPVWGNYIISNHCNDQKAQVKVETKVNNDFDKTETVLVRNTVISSEGKVVAEAEKELELQADSSAKMVQEIEVPSPMLWSQEHPNRYVVQTTILKGKSVIYSEKNKIGIRKLEYSSTDGFKLNGKVIKLKGVCLHTDGGPLGAAIYRHTIERQLDKLREMGCNAIRTSHNPFSSEFMDVCDSMGFLVMNEMFDEWEIPKEPMTVQNGKKIRIPVDYYASKFKKWSDRDLTDFVLRDRNHPSVIMWSIGNEIDQMREPSGVRIGKRLAAIVHKLDYRPVTNGMNGYGWGVWPNPEAAATSDVRGYNYIDDKGFDKERKLNPNALAIVTEHESAQSFYPRSTYLYGDAKKAWWKKLGYKYQDSYKWVETRGLLGESGMKAWEWVKKRPYVMGMFIWTGWDYIGETIPFGWPAHSSSFAPIDLAGFPKDGYYFYQSQWTEKPMVHLFPNWNLTGMEGKKVTVYGFTNGEEVELFQDGKSLGKQKNNRDSVEYQSWNVTYRPGELKAVAYRNGKKVAEEVVRTAGAPARINAVADRPSMKANAQDLIYVECTIKDKDNNTVPTASNKLDFSVEGPAAIAGVGNGDNMSLERFKANTRHAFNGKCLVILKSTKTKGPITLHVKSDGLEPISLTMESN